jgi:hypothetical protein
MPNHVTNVVTFEGDRDEIIDMLERISGSGEGSMHPDDYPCINFSKIKPMPEAVQNTTSPTRQEKGETREEYDARVTKLMELYGAADWYSWAVDNWGTKWNAYSQEEVDWNVIRFDTAWSTPMQLFMELAEQYPNILIKVSYADEDLGYNCGKFEFLETLTDEWHPDPFGGDEANEFACQLRYRKSYADLEAEWAAEEAEYEAEQKAEEEAAAQRAKEVRQGRRGKNA